MLGESNELKAAQEKLLVFGLAALLTILLLLQAALGSFRLALLTFVLLPMALVGGVVAVLLSGAVLSLGSLVGFLAVFGIAARNGILMVSHFRHLERDEGMEFGRDLVIQGATERLAPILMTALATGLALIPLVVAGSIPGTRSSIRWPSWSSAGCSPPQWSTCSCCPRCTCGSADAAASRPLPWRSDRRPSWRFRSPRCHGEA